MKLAGRGTCVAVVAVLAVSTVAAAGEEDADTIRAKALFAEGKRRFEVAQYDDALKLFQEAYVAKPLPPLLYNVGQCQRLLYRHGDAVQSFLRYLELSPAAPNRAEVEGLIASEREAIARNEAEWSKLPKTADAPANPSLADPGAPEVTTVPAEAVAAPAPAQAPAAPPSSRAPSRWWIWAIVGGVAAVAVGVGLGVGLSEASKTPASPTTFVFQSGALFGSAPSSAAPAAQVRF